MTVETWHCDGWCPFLLCLQTEAHDHPICPDCGAMRFGALDCPTCRLYYDLREVAFQAAYQAEGVLGSCDLCGQSSDLCGRTKECAIHPKTGLQHCRICWAEVNWALIVARLIECQRKRP